MDKSKVITWEEYREKTFTKKELKEIDKKVKKVIAMRELKELREKKNLTQEKLSEVSGIPRSTISRIETGKRNVSIEKLIQIADALGRDLEIRFVERKK